MKKFGFPVWLLALVLSGCASYPTDPAQQAIYHAEQAQGAFAKGDIRKALGEISHAIGLPGGPARVKAMFLQNPNMKSKYIDLLLTDSAALSDTYAAKQYGKTLNEINASLILDASEVARVQAKYEEALISGNNEGSLPFMVDQWTMNSPALSKAEQMKIIFARTLRAHEDRNFTSRDIRSLLEYVKKTGPGSVEEQQFKGALTRLNVRATELPELEQFAPDFVALRKEQITLRAHLVVKNGDRIFADDLSTELSKVVRGVTWLQTPEKGALELIVEKVRASEKEFSEQTRTVTYSYHQVDIFAAALLMPRNASYQFDLKTGGAEVEYGYVISAYRNGGKLTENVVRGKIGGESRRCENARIINVFGGVSAAGFLANDDMRQACSSTSKVSLDDLRSQVMRKIADGVLAVPDVSAVTSMN